MINSKRKFLIPFALLIMWGLLYAWDHARPIYNGTVSMPEGWYLLDTTDTTYELDKIVTIKYRSPQWVKDRGYSVPDGMMFLKRIMAVPGDQLKIEGRKIYRCRGHCELIAERLETDTAGRKFPPLDLPETVPEGRYFLATDHTRSFDSRYLGLWSQSDIIGTAVALYLD